jgi:uncharacterized protein with FMN-binding domain
VRASLRRVLLAVCATAVAVLLLVGLKGTEQPPPVGAEVLPGGEPDPGPSIVRGPVRLPAGTYMVTGDPESTPFGPVQVRIDVAGRRIVEVTALRAPKLDGHSKEISAFAVPELRREALAAQSAAIDAVSGATYTTVAYQESLQSALNKAAAGQHD